MTHLTHRIVIAAGCGLIAVGVLFVAQRTEGAKESPPDVLPKPVLTSERPPRDVRRVVVTHDRPGQVIFSWDGPDLRVELRDASPK